MSLLEQIERVHFQCRVFHDDELQSVVDEVARYTTIAIRIEDEAIKSKKITGVLQIGNVDLMFEGIEGPLGVRVNRVSTELVSLSARRNPHGKRCMSVNPIRNLFILNSNYLLPTYSHVLPTYYSAKLFADCIQATIE